MSRVVCTNGVLGPAEEARVSIFDRGFLYGDSIFEVLRTYGGKPFREREHLERLERSAGRVLIELPAPLAVFSEEIARTLEAAGNEESYLRVVVTRGSGPLSYDPATAENPLRLVVVVPLPKQPQSLYEDGVAVRLVRSNRPTDDTGAAGAKAGNYLANLLAVHEARSSGGYEAIFVGPGGQVVEGASSNIFVVKDGCVRTPRPEAGILEGITRATILEVAKTEGIELVEGVLFPRDLYDADEVFITSSLREVVPVVDVDARAVADGRPGAMTTRLHSAFRRAVGV